ncbi:MAG TPA: hypothetical protein VL326_36950 [Kofleriaceae bacterium]|nr:hypothetical protein [Kofleriaceae bacterium]
MRVLGILLTACLAACGAEVGGTHQESQEKEPPTGNGSGGEHGNDTTTTATGYLTQIAGVYCSESFTCRADFPLDRGYTFEAQWGNSEDECTTRLLDGWNPAAIETEIAKGRAEYDGSAGIACLNGVTFGTCGDYWTAGIHWADACYHVIKGLVPAGGACDNAYACVSQQCDAVAHTCL